MKIERMTRWIMFTLAVVAVTAVITESRVIPAEPISVMMDAYGNPIVFLREKRTPVHPYPQQAMMFTSYYRPVRRSGNQAGGVFAQGNAVSGQAFFDMQSPLMKNGPEPIEEPEISSAEAQAAPSNEEAFGDQEEERNQEEGYQPQHHHQQAHHHYQDEQAQEEPHEAHPHHEYHQHHHHNQEPTQEHHDPETATAFTTEASDMMPAEEEPLPSSTEATVNTPVNTPKVHNVKKVKKPPVVVDEDDEDDMDMEDEDHIPFIPMKGNRRRTGYPNLNNFFPMMFSFPGVATRDGSSGSSPPGTITAIANSYSTGKGGVANSVATAYGGSPPGKKRRMPQSEE